MALPDGELSVPVVGLRLVAHSVVVVVPVVKFVAIVAEMLAGRNVVPTSGESRIV